MASGRAPGKEGACPVQRVSPQLRLRGAEFAAGRALQGVAKCAMAHDACMHAHAIYITSGEACAAQPCPPSNLARLHLDSSQAVEAKEGVPVSSENYTTASVSYQSLFGYYRRLAGMTVDSFLCCVLLVFGAGVFGAGAGASHRPQGLGFNRAAGASEQQEHPLSPADPVSLTATAGCFSAGHWFHRAAGV